MLGGIPVLITEGNLPTDGDAKLRVLCAIRPGKDGWTAIIWNTVTNSLDLLESEDYDVYTIDGMKLNPDSIIDIDWRKVIPVNMLLDMDEDVVYPVKHYIHVPTDAKKQIEAMMKNFSKEVDKWKWFMTQEDNK